MKKIIVILIIIIAIGVPIYLFVNNQRAQDDFYAQLNDFSILLKEQNYEQAKIVYEGASDSLKANYNISLDGHAHTLVEEAKKAESTQASLDLLYSYNEIGYTSHEIDTAILYYEDLLQSNYIYQKGLEYFNNSEFESAMECFADVLEYDENYANAQAHLHTYQEYMLAWEEAANNNAYGRSPSPNAVAYKGGNMYVPYRFTDSYAILKINTSTNTILSFPIILNESGAKVSDLNIIGNYIFFLVQRNDTSIKENDNQNAVYRISLDGDELTKIVDCDYTYMLSYRDKFYAISKSKGLIETDRYFLEEKVLVESDEIMEIQLVDGGIFYTIDQKDSDINIQYFFDGETSTEVMQEVNMHYYDYGIDNIIYYDLTGYSEYLYHENMATGNPNNNPVYTGDVYKYYGMLNSSAIFTYLGNYQQECIGVRDIKKLTTTYRSDRNEIGYVPLGICYDTGLILLSSDAGISFTTENMRIQETIALPHVNNSALIENEESQENASRFSDKEETFTEENRWLYSDDLVNISTEKVYLDVLESIVYITHIYTSDYKWLKNKVLNANADPIDSLIDDVWAMPGEIYDEDRLLIDEDKGTISTDAYVFNDDGMFIVYREANVIPAEKVIASTVTHVFTQGEVIVENYEVTNDSTNDGGTLDGRSAIGMVEPGHYVSVIAQSPSRQNKGITLYTLANILVDQGCISAYNFDYSYPPFVLFMGEYIYEEIQVDVESNAKNQVLYY